MFCALLRWGTGASIDEACDTVFFLLLLSLIQNKSGTYNIAAMFYCSTFFLQAVRKRDRYFVKFIPVERYFFKVDWLYHYDIEYVQELLESSFWRYRSVSSIGPSTAPFFLWLSLKRLIDGKITCVRKILLPSRRAQIVRKVGCYRGVADYNTILQNRRIRLGR